MNILPLEIIELIAQKLSTTSCSSVVVMAYISKLFYDISRKCAKDNKISRLIDCSMIALEGHLEVLKWARENGCEWDYLTCAYAAKNGHLEVLKWARENGCDWNSWTCAYAAHEWTS